MKFRFQKNNRGYSDLTFPFLRATIIGATKLLFRPRLVNPENMPTTGPCFLFGNHSNYFDPFLMNAWHSDDPTAGVMTREQFHKTLPALFMDSVGIVPTSKYVPEPTVIRSVMRMIDQRRMIVIFPEGGRRWDGRPKSLIESTLKLFYKMKIPVHPVQIHGAFLTWPRWADYPRYGICEIHFLKPLIPGDYTDYETFAHECREAINFDEYFPPETCYPRYAYQPAAGVERLLYRCPDTGINNGIYSPDGHHIFSRHTSLKYEMSPDSRLIDEHGDRHSLIELFDKMTKIPMFTDGDFVLREMQTGLFEVNRNHQLIELGQADITLYADQLTINGTYRKQSIPIEKLLYISIEQNHKVSITGEGFTYHFYCQHSSALQWQQYIHRLKSGEKAIKP